VFHVWSPIVLTTRTESASQARLRILFRLSTSGSILTALPAPGSKAFVVCRCAGI
jgi:hypothetical protein